MDKNQIELLHELPGVGQNLQDHLDVIISCKEKGTESYGFSRTPKGIWKSAKDFFSYLRDSSGPLASNAAESGGFIRSSLEVSHPDIQYHFVPGRFFVVLRVGANGFHEKVYLLTIVERLYMVMDILFIHAI